MQTNKNLPFWLRKKCVFLDIIPFSLFGLQSVVLREVNKQKIAD
jgi:hypothetical protein